MRVFSLAGFALGSCCAASMVGCGSPSQTSGIVPGLRDSVRQPPQGKSWMAKDAAKWDLLYVSNGNGVVNVYRYWKRNLIGTLTGFQQPFGECVDNAGNVYIADYYANSVSEYAHGGKKPLRVITDSISHPYACAVNPKTGDLAVANQSAGVAIFRNATQKPILYTDRNLFTYEALAYNDRGTLLVSNGCFFDSSCYEASFALLQPHAINLKTIRIPGPGSSDYYEGVQAIQWDGKYWVIADYALYRISISGTRARFIGATYLTNFDGSPVWIYRKTLGSPGTQVVGTSGFDNDRAVSFWEYPAGGDAVGEITHGVDNPSGVTVSLKTVH